FDAERVRIGEHPGEIALRLLDREPDRRAGEDVVELVQQQRLPEPVELGARILLRRAKTREELSVVQRGLAAPVQRLRASLRRVRAAVVLEVQLADDDRALARLGLQSLEELVARRDSCPRHSLQITGAP